jgi:hypothetical protein
MARMKTNIPAFQRDFRRRHRLAGGSTGIVEESDGPLFEFRRRRAGTGVLGCMTGRAKLGQLRDGPAIPLEEWGALAQ